MKFKIILFLSLGLFSFHSKKESIKSRRPNILFIPIDDLRPDFETYGNTILKTPNMNRIARVGVTFNRAYCQQAVCNPSRASLMTGLRPDRLRVWDLQTNMRKITPDLVTIPQYFKQNGYTTIGLGKTFHNIFPDSLSWTKDIHIEGTPFDPDAMYAGKESLDIIETKKKKFADENNFSRIDKYGNWYIKANATENAEVPDDAYFDALQTEAAIAQMKILKVEDKPFFLSVGYYKPHLPFNAPKKYWDLYDRSKLELADNEFIPKNSPSFAVHGDQELRSYDDYRDLPLPTDRPLDEERQRELVHGYYACVSYIDAQIGHLLDALENLGMADNTIIVLWGDHGWKLGEHNSWAKQSNYEIDTRVPLIIGGRGVRSKNTKSASLVEFIDLFPSLCELAHLKIPVYLPGKSLVPILNNPMRKTKMAAYSQFLLGRFPKNSKTPERMGYTVRTDRYRYVEWYQWQNDEKGNLIAKELFDHKNDPKENENTAYLPENVKLIDQLSILLSENFKK
ncbi:MAG: sulfatase [Saprospiraceae bacterium]